LALSLNMLQHFNDAFNRHDVAAMMDDMTNDCVFENTFPAPDGTRYEGQAAVREFWVNFFKSSPHAHLDIEDIIATEDRCVQCWVYHWIDEQGKSGHVRGVDVFRLRGGKIAEKLSYVKG
jgi:ketosteroid isomerase-like protein